jgi:hypothetical protein
MGEIQVNSTTGSQQKNDGSGEPAVVDRGQSLVGHFGAFGISGPQCRASIICPDSVKAFVGDPF